MARLDRFGDLVMHSDAEAHGAVSDCGTSSPTHDGHWCKHFCCSGARSKAFILVNIASSN